LQQVNKTATTAASGLSAILPDGYEKDTQQGAVLSQTQIAELKVGMSKYQVKQIIGSPTIIDPFHNNRWDYINNSKIAGKKQNFHLQLMFNDNNQLTKIIQHSDK
jgi:outer membrane protein assembly factor BamE